MSRIPEGLPTSNSNAYPPHRAISGQIARSLDKAATDKFQIPSVVLMEHASRAVAQVVTWLCEPSDTVLVLCGPGNNGGDGYGAARFLHSWGYGVRVLRLSARPPSPEGDAGREAALVAADGVQIEDASQDPGLVGRALAARPAVVIDAIFGTGAKQGLRKPWLSWVEAVNASEAVRLSVDVPSGLDADTGAVAPVCVRADVTATMVAPKIGFRGREEVVGHVVEVDIGLPAALHGQYLVPPPPPSRQAAGSQPRRPTPGDEPT